MLPNTLDLTTRCQNVLFLGFRKSVLLYYFSFIRAYIFLEFIILKVITLDCKDLLDYQSGLRLKS